MKKIRPLNDVVVIKPIEDELQKTDAGVLIPSFVKKKNVIKGKVVAVGPGTDSAPMTLKEGDVILVPVKSVTAVSVDRDDFGVLVQGHVIAVIEDE